jgi:hypothetical protein
VDFGIRKEVIMHGMSCSCPSCRGNGARELEFESFEFGETQELLS